MNLETFKVLFSNYEETMEKVTVFEPICDIIERFLKPEWWKNIWIFH